MLKLPLELKLAARHCAYCGNLNDLWDAIRERRKENQEKTRREQQEAILQAQWDDHDHLVVATWMLINHEEGSEQCENLKRLIQKLVNRLDLEDRTFFLQKVRWGGAIILPRAKHRPCKTTQGEKSQREITFPKPSRGWASLGDAIESWRESASAPM